MLLASGYLKAVSSAPNSSGNIDYQLTLTNLEIKHIFENMFIGWFSDGRAGYHHFEQTLLRGSVKEMNVYRSYSCDTAFEDCCPIKYYTLSHQPL